MIINGIDFDRKLDDLKQNLHWRIEYYIWPMSNEVLNLYKHHGFLLKVMDSMIGIPPTFINPNQNIS